MASSDYDVCALGNAIVDIVADVPDDFLPQQHIAKDAMMLVDRVRINTLRKSLKKARAVRAGGASGNMVAGIASFGGKAAYMGKIGHDEVGQLFSADLKKLGVYFPTAPMMQDGEATGLCISFVTPDAHRSMCTYLGASVDFGANDVHTATLRASQAVYLEGYMLDRASTRLALMFAAAETKTAKRKVALALCDPACVERNRKDFLELLSGKTDLLFANERELMTLMRCSALEPAIDAVKTQVETAIVTRSEKGAIIAHAGQQIVIEAEKVPRVVDKTGAGDAFAAGFLYGLARGFELAKCGKLGSFAAAEIIAHYGPRPEHALGALAKKKGLL